MKKVLLKLLKILLWMITIVVILFVVLVVAVIIYEDNKPEEPSDAVTLNEDTKKTPVKVIENIIPPKTIIKEHLRHNKVANIFEDLALYPEERSYLDSLIVTCVDFSDERYSQLEKYKRYAVNDSIVVHHLDSLMSDLESDTYYEISNMSSIGELAEYYRENLEDVPYLEDYLREVIVSKIPSAPYAVAKNIQASFQGTPTGHRIDSLYYPVRDSLIRIVLAELQDEFDKERYVIEELRLMSIKDACASLEPRVIDITSACLDKANDDYLGDVLDLVVDEINQFMDEKLDEGKATAIRQSVEKAMAAFASGTTKGYEFVDKIISNLGSITDSTFLRKYDQFALRGGLSEKLVNKYLPELNFLYKARFRADTLSGRIVIENPDDVSLPQAALPYKHHIPLLTTDEQDEEIPASGSNTLSINFPHYNPEFPYTWYSENVENWSVPHSPQVSQEESFRQKFVSTTVRHFKQFTSGEGLHNYMDSLCRKDLGLASIRDSVTFFVDKYSYAANRNRYNIMSSALNMDIDTSFLYVNPAVINNTSLIVDVPMQKIDNIQRLKFNEFNYDISSFTVGVAAGIALPFGWGLLFDLGDFVAGMYVGMKVMDLVGEDVQKFGEELATVSINSSIDYINAVYDEIESDTQKSQEAIKNYIYENF